MIYLLLTSGAAAAPAAAQATLPPDLSAMMMNARVDGKIMRWCPGEFRPGRPRAYAAAVASTTGGGRYVVLDGEAVVVELAPFKDAPDLTCYTPAEARTLGESIRRSGTVSGLVAPIFETTVVCAFVDNTSAVCWQYSPKARAFVKVGEWQT